MISNQDDPPRPRFTESSFIDTTINVDSSDFIACVFENCKLVYSGGPLPRLEHCDIRDSDFIFAGPAHNTVLFLANLIHGAKDGDDYVIRTLFGLENWTRKNAP